MYTVSERKKEREREYQEPCNEIEFARTRVLPQITCRVLIIGLSGIFFTTNHHGISQMAKCNPGGICLMHWHAQVYLYHKFQQYSCTNVCVYLWWCWGISIAGQYFQCDPSTTFFQHLLELSGIIADIFPIHLLYDVTHMQQPLPVNQPSVKDASDHQVTLVHSEGHTLTAQTQNEPKISFFNFELKFGFKIWNHIKSYY